MVMLRHPDIEVLGGPVPDDPTVLAHWKTKGFVPVTEAEAVAAEVVGRPVEKLETLKVDELEQVADRLGLDRTAVKKKDGLLQLLEGSDADDTAGEPDAPAPQG